MATRAVERPLRLVGLALGTALVCNLALKLSSGISTLSAVAHALALAAVVVLIRSRRPLSNMDDSLWARWLVVLFEPPERSPHSDEE